MKYAGIISNDIADSLTGINVSFWVQGCPIHCKGCHNPQTWDPGGGIELPNNYLDIIDNALTANGVQRGLSLLGGEVFASYNISLTKSIVEHVDNKFPNIKIYAWTGYVFEDLIKEYGSILKHIDFLIDGPFEIDKRDVTLKLRGSSNQRIIDIPKTIATNSMVLLDNN